MVLDGMGWDRPTEWAVAATERTQTESSTLANPGRTSLHSQPETHITQVVRPEWEKCVQGKGKGKRDQAMGLTPMVMSLLAAESGKLRTVFPRSSNARGMLWWIRIWNVEWESGSDGSEGSDGYHSASWPGHQLIYGYAQGTNWGWIGAKSVEKGGNSRKTKNTGNKIVRKMSSMGNVCF